MEQKWFIRQLHRIMLFTNGVPYTSTSVSPPLPLLCNPTMRKLTRARPPRRQH